MTDYRAQPRLSDIFPLPNEAKPLQIFVGEWSIAPEESGPKKIGYGTVQFLENCDKILTIFTSENLFRETLEKAVPPVLILLLLPLSASPLLFASPSVPFKATFTGTFIFTSTGTITVYGSGTASHLGACNVSGTATPTTSAEGQGVITAASGNELYLSVVGTVTFTSPTTASFSGTYTITGGTGSFEHATGTGDTTVEAVLTGPAGGTFSATLSGTLSK